MLQAAAKLSWWLWALSTVIKFNSCSKAGENELLLPSNIQCACSNQLIHFTCTVAVIGVGATIWTGTAFSCVENMNEIILRHSRFNESEGTFGSCNNGAISARSMGVDGNCYTSELSIRTSAEMNGRTVRCISNSNSGMVTVGDATISIVSGPYQQAPANVNLVNVHPGELTFNWSQVDPNCPAVQYQVTSNCGDCSVISGNTSATCSSLQLSATGRNCIFSVGSMICGFTGPSSNPITVTLKVPDAPRITPIPVYSFDSKTLIGLFAQIFQMSSFSIYEGISGSVVNYTVHYLSGANETIPANCTGEVCEYMFQVPSTVCPLSRSVMMINVSAANMLGSGQHSELFPIGCTNDFVTVNIDPSASTLTCLFQNSRNTTTKMCSVQYSQCNQEAAFSNGNSTSDRVILQFSIPRTSDCYSYTIRASDGTNTVIVKHWVEPGKSSSTTMVIAVVVTIIFIFVILVVTITLGILFCKGRMKRHIPPGVNQRQVIPDGDGTVVTYNVMESNVIIADPEYHTEDITIQSPTEDSTFDESYTGGHGIPDIYQSDCEDHTLITAI